MVDVTQGERQLQINEEDLETFWVTFPEMKTMIAEGQITDADTLGAWALYQTQEN